MRSIRTFFGNPHIQLSLATGISIIALAYFSKRVLAEPLGYLELAFPPFLMTVWEAVVSKHKDAWYAKPLLWILAIIAATVIVIAVNA